jgi:hypothetical protein
MRRKKVKIEIENLNNVIFEENILKFDKSDQKINESILGKIVGYIEIYSSFIFSSRIEVRDLMSLCQFFNISKMELQSE